jgi:thiol:disulfide interchange protein
MREKFIRSVLVLSLLSLTGCEVRTEPAGDTSSASSTDSADTYAQSGNGPIAKGQLNFVRGYQTGYEQAMRVGKPMLIFFTAEWCHYCHQMADEAFTDQQVVNLSQNFVCVLVDQETEPEVGRQFRVAGWPTVLFLSPRGVALNRIVGKKPGHQVVMAMQAALQNIARRSDNGTWR